MIRAAKRNINIEIMRTFVRLRWMLPFHADLTRFEPLRVVLRDNGFVSDTVKINVVQIFRQMLKSIWETP